MKKFFSNLIESDVNIIYVYVLFELWAKSNRSNQFEVYVDDLMKLIKVKSRNTLPNFFEAINIGNKDKKLVTYKEFFESRKKKIVLNFGEVKSVDKDLNDLKNDLYDFLFDYYNRKNYQYTNLKNSMPTAVAIYNKLVKLASNKDTNVLSYEDKIQVFKVFFEKIPEWWVENQNLGLATINKHFDKIINQIKAKGNDKFQQLAENSEQFNFEEFTSDGSGGSWADAF